MSDRASSSHRASQPEPALDQTEREQPAASFAEVTRWLVILSALMAAAYGVTYLVTRDPRLMPILLVCAGFSTSVALIREFIRNLRFTVYLVGALIAAGMIGVAASVAGIDELLVISTLTLPVFFIGLLLTPQDMFRAVLLSAVGAFLAEWIGHIATWPRLDLATIPGIQWLAHVLVDTLILFLAAALFRRLDRAVRSARESARQLQLLYETSRLFGSKRTLDELLPEVANNIAKIVEATGCFIVLRDPGSGELLPTAADSAHHDTYRRLRVRPDEPSLAAVVIQRCEPVGIEDVHHSPHINPRAAALFPTDPCWACR